MDRRLFLRRMAALTAAASSGAALPGDLRAEKLGGGGLSPATALPAPRSRPADPADLTLSEASALIRDGELAPLELVEAYLERIERLDDVYLAFNTVLAETARREARRLARAPWRGPLHGIPLAMKDNFYTTGVRTSANSYIFQDFVPEWDATAWARLREAGAILLGKTQMGPLATSRATTPDGERTTVNAWAPEHPAVSPGGSSSGSATAVAARMAAAATGTQTGGSITNPASEQGLTGLKPTMGRVSLRGIVPLTYTRDHPGPIARDAMDAALLLQAMAGPDPEDPRTLGLPPVPDYVRAATPVRGEGRPGLRWPTTIGVLPGYLEVEEPEAPDEEERREMDARQRREREEERRREGIRVGEAVAARRRMLETFEELGARVVEVDHPADWETLTSREFNNVRLPERSESFLEVLRDDVRKFGVSLSPWINGLLLPGAEYLRGQRAKLVLLRRVLDEVFSACDAVVQTRPFPFDMIGLPLVAFPIGYETRSIGSPRPLAGMLGGLPYAEDRLLSLAAAFQAVTDFHRRRPDDPDDAPPGDRMAPERARPPWGPPGNGGGGGGRGALGRGRVDLDEVMERGE
ncbi:MAG TPA: amidase [Longimicrobiales bacterium]|nr:amidase [Longimicrobiales bacterium]